jgi:hypothetical protein
LSRDGVLAVGQLLLTGLISSVEPHWYSAGGGCWPRSHRDPAIAEDLRLLPTSDWETFRPDRSDLMSFDHCGMETLEIFIEHTYPADSNNLAEVLNRSEASSPCRACQLT